MIASATVDTDPRGAPESTRKRPSDYVRFVGPGLGLIVSMGVLRFAVGVSEVPYDRATHLTSVTILVFLLAVVYGQRAAARRFGGYRHLVPLALLLSATMYGVIVTAIAVESATGWRGYFHAPGSGYAPHGMGVRDHVLGQLSVMPTMTTAIWGVLALGFALARHLAHLGTAVLALAALAVIRFIAAPAGVPYGIGTWLTSVTLASIALVGYYAYRAPSGLDRYPHALLMAFIIAFVTFHLVVYGFVVSEGLDVATYFNASAPGGTDTPSFIEAQLRAAPVLVGVSIAAACIGLALRRRIQPTRARRMSGV